MFEKLKQHKDYLYYTFKHKYWVYKVGVLFDNSLSWKWKLLTHDLSKFLPSEWFGYVRWKYEQTLEGREGNVKNDRGFGWSWFLHMNKRNPHHWQYYIYTDDNTGESYPVEMGLKDAQEMLVDWAAAGIVRFGEPGLQKYYELNKDNIVLHLNTRAYVEDQLEFVEQVVHDSGILEERDGLSIPGKRGR